MSGRTLQRRITGEGTSFRRLLNEARQELAQFYLKEPSLGTSEIAYVLSYEDPSSFFRAFHDWEGMPPREWRDCENGKKKSGQRQAVARKRSTSP